MGIQVLGQAATGAKPKRIPRGQHGDRLAAQRQHGRDIKWHWPGDAAFPRLRQGQVPGATDHMPRVRQGRAATIRQTMQPILPHAND